MSARRLIRRLAQSLERTAREDALGRREQGLALEAAGAVGDVVRGEGVAQAVQRDEPVRSAMGGFHERQGGTAQLAEAGFEERCQVRAAAQLAMLPRRFGSAGMREAAGRERRIRELPEEPVRHVQKREYRWASGRTLAGSHTSASPSAVTA